MGKICARNGRNNDAFGADDRRQHADERREDDQREAQAVDADLVEDVEGRNPLGLLYELERYNGYLNLQLKLADLRAAA